MSEQFSDFAPTASLAALQLRASLLRRIREFFDSRGFLEVDTPLLSSETVVDRHLDPFRVVVYDDPRAANEGSSYWLQTSPEFAMKRLLAAHGVSIFQVTHAFRAGERGRWHNPEFTLVEWYGVGDDYWRGMRLLNEFCESLLGRGPAEFVSYSHAFQKHVGMHPFSVSLDELARKAANQGIPVPQSLTAADRDAWLELFMTERVEQHLGQGHPTILYDYPATQAALSRIRVDEFAVAERFELYVDGVELANGYHELLDADLLLARTAANNEQRVRAGKEALPAHSRLLAAMRHGLPGCTGVALGFDRLAMLLSGSSSLDDVLPFPFPRA